MLRKIWLPFLVLFLFFAWVDAAQAGFGVSPPHIKNHQLAPGSTFQQQIMLLRSEANDELKATVKINAPEIESWISIDKGSEFPLPPGELQVPMIVTFKIPKGAEIGNYTGNINVKIVPSGNNSGGVAIALGARIDIDLAVTNVSYADFFVRLVSVPDFERLGAPWNWKVWSNLYEKLFYRVRVVMNIENKGNVKIAPSKVVLEVSDISKKQTLETSEDKTLRKVKPFSTGEVVADFPTKLGTGQYWGKIKIYKGEEIVNVYEIAFSVVKAGSLGSGARSLGAGPWLVMIGMVVLAVALFFTLIKIKVWRYLILLLLLPIRPIFILLKSGWSGLSRKFWQWVHRQAEKHKEEKDGKIE